MINLRNVRLLFAAATIVAMVYQFFHNKTYEDFTRIVHFFSFFTIQSNIICAVVLILLATKWEHDTSPIVTLIRGAAVAYITTTFVVYGLLLAGYEDALQTTLPWVNNTLHRIFPLYMIVDWIISRPKTRLDFRTCLIWMVYPIAYLIYSLVRGPIVDWYPYPFLNPDEAGGYAGVAGTSIGIAIGFVVFIWIIVTLANRPWEDRA